MNVIGTGRPRCLLTLLLVIVFVLSACAGGTPQATATTVAPEATPTVAAAEAPTLEATEAVEPTTAAEPGDADSLIGRYVGAIDVAGQRIEIEVEFTQVEQEIVGVMDIPVQGAIGVPLNEIIYAPPEISFSAFSGNSLAAFAGEVGEEGVISGTFVQLGVAGTFTLEPAALVEEPVPYAEEEVVFSHGDISLAGTLSIPEGEGPFPAVVLISGTGAQTRDENVFGFRVFFEIADHLTRNGIAVLRYDDRGVGGSTGDPSQATQSDLAEDVLAGVEFLVEHEAIDASAIGLIGHSEGGYVAPLAATQSEDIAYLVLLAGPATSGEEVLVDQLDLILRAQGASEEQIATAKEQQQQTIEAVKTGEGWDEIRASVEAELRAVVEGLPEAQREALGDVDEFVESAAEDQIAGVNNPWFRSFVEYDPEPALLEVDVPVLALFGELDLQVPAETNAEVMRETLASGGLEDFQVEVIPSANHLFQEAVTGAVEEYATLERAFAPGVLDLITEWIQERTG